MTETDIQNLAAEVATALSRLRGESWQPGSSRGYSWCPRMEIAGPAGAAVAIEQADGRVAADSVYPDGCCGPHYRITVAVARGPQVIAANISRRLLDAGYLDSLKKAQADKAAADQREAARTERMAEVAALFGVQQTDDHKVDLSDYLRGTGKVEEYYASDGQALTISLSGVPRKTALKMLQVLARAPGEARCCYQYGPRHDPRLSGPGCLHPDCCDGGNGSYAEAEALFGLYHASQHTVPWHEWLGDAADHIHPIWR